MNENAFFQYKENRAHAGYKSAWLIKLPENNGKFSLLSATESVPYVFGDKDTHEFNLLQSPVVGQVEGKMSLEQVTVEVLHHRDNAYRFDKLRGKTYEFMCINAEFVGYRFTGTLDYRPNTAEADVNKATVTITPMDATPTAVYNARPLVLETLCFANAIPDTVKTTDKVDFSVTQTGAVLTFEVVKIADETNAESVASSSEVDTTNPKEVQFKVAGLYAVTVKADGFGSWTTTVYAE